MISAFTDVLHVPNLTTDAQMMNVLKQSDAFSKDDLAKLASKLKGRKASIGGGFFSVNGTARPRVAKASFGKTGRRICSTEGCSQPRYLAEWFVGRLQL